MSGLTLNTQHSTPCELCGEVAEEGGLVCEADAADGFTLGEGFKYHFREVVYVALGVDAARNRKANEVHRREGLMVSIRIPLAEHNAPDLYGTDSAGEIERADEGLAGILLYRNLRQERAGVDVDRMPAGRL